MKQRTLRPRSLAMAVAMMGLPTVAVALCIAIVTTAITTNGIVVSPKGVGVTSTCPGDPGWAGVVGRQFIHIGEGPDPADKPTLFLAGYGTPITKFYVGVHVPFDPDLRRQDRVSLYFDANNSGTLNNGDFALVYEVGPSTAIVSNETCNVAPGQVQIYKYIEGPPGAWGPGSTTTPGIISKVAYDYDATPDDSESKLWELEIELDAVTTGLSPSGFRLGAKLLPHEIIIQGPNKIDHWQTFIWPVGLTGDTDPLDYFPGVGDVTPDHMAALDFTDCADVFIDAISATAPNGHNNEFRRPKSTDWIGGQTPTSPLPVNLQNRFSASVRFFNPSDPTDNSAVAVPNTGNIQFLLRPHGTGGFLAEVSMANPTLSFNHLGQILTPSFGWPVRYSDYQPIESIMDHDSDHSCLKISLSGFLVNLDPDDDVRYRNLTYTPLSTRIDTFLVTTRTPQLREVRGEIEFIMRTRWKNLPDKFAKGWKFQIDNLDSLGAKDLGNGYYRFYMGPQQDRQVVFRMSGGDMPNPPQEIALDARAGGTVLDSTDGVPPVALQVKEGQMVSVIALGKIRVLADSLFNGANGRSDRERTNQHFLLGSRVYSGYEHIGAIVGSFDGFKTGFVVGADKSFIVPLGANKLELAVNDVAGQYKNNRDGRFDLFVFISDPRTLPTQYQVADNPQFGQPAVLEPAANVPQLDIDVFRAVPLKPRTGPPPPPDSRLLIPHAYVGYAVYQSHGEVNPPSPGGCGSKSPVGAALLVGTSGLGILLVRRPRKRPRK